MTASSRAREIVSDAVLAEFNAWMAGVAEYHELSPAGKAYCDEYLEDYWREIESLCAAAGA